MCRIYGKATDMKRFLALDLSSGSFVRNLLYASLLTRDDAERALAELRQDNPDIEFEVREA